MKIDMDLITKIIEVLEVAGKTPEDILCIVGNDFVIERHERNGSEWWECKGKLAMLEK
jgi:hypothetical protein